MLDSEIDVAILAIATEKMAKSDSIEWPEIKRWKRNRPSVCGCSELITLMKDATHRLRRITVHS